TSVRATRATVRRCRRAEPRLPDIRGGSQAMAAPVLASDIRGIPMSKTSRLVGALLLTSALVTPGFAYAQNDPTVPAETPPSGEEPQNSAPDAPPAEEPTEEDVDVSVPGGGEIIVTGLRERNIAKASDQVLSVLSSAEIARTGEGNIA